MATWALVWWICTAQAGDTIPVCTMRINLHNDFYACVHDRLRRGGMCRVWDDPGEAVYARR